MYAGAAKEQIVHLNGVIRGHQFQDTPVVVVYDIDEDDPDEIVFLYLESVSGNALTTLSNSLSNEDIDNIIQQIELT